MIEVLTAMTVVGLICYGFDVDYAVYISCLVCSISGVIINKLNQIIKLLKKTY